MVLEVATFLIKAGQSRDFISAQEEAIGYISRSKGFLEIKFRQCIENPDKHIAFIGWETLDDHTIGFRESQNFVEWRRVLSPFFETAPQVEHYS